MDDTSRNSTVHICKVLEDLKGSDVLALNLGPTCSWVDFFVIVTANSRVHMNGLAEATRDKMEELGFEVSGGKKNDGDAWRIINGGNLVVSLMDSKPGHFTLSKSCGLNQRLFTREEVGRRFRLNRSSRRSAYRLLDCLLRHH